MTLQRTIKLYKLPEDIKTSGFRKLQTKDLKKVQKLLTAYLNRFDLAPVFDYEEMVHWFTPKENVVDSFVVEVCLLLSKLPNNANIFYYGVITETC